MLLSPEEAKLVFKLHCALMQFVNEQLGLVGVPGSAAPYAALPPQKRHEVVQAFVGRLDLIDAFIAANPARLCQEELGVVSTWRHLVSGRFIALRQLKKHMILLTCDGTPTAYAVTGLVDPMEQVIPQRLPAMIVLVSRDCRSDGRDAAGRIGRETRFTTIVVSTTIQTAPASPSKERPVVATNTPKIATVES